jgi:hypothetical protein
MTAAKAGLKRINSGSGHRYTLDGEKCIGVTTAMSAGLPKPALVGWAARTVAEYVADRLEQPEGTKTITADRLLRDLREWNKTRKWPEKLNGDLPRIGVAKLLGQVQYAQRDEAANRGTDVHTLASRLADGEEVTVPEPLVPFVDSYLKFLDEWDVDVELTEFIVGHRRWNYAGTGDLIAMLFGERWLLDIKTSGSGVYGETGLQLAAYGNAEFYLAEDGTEQPLPSIDRYGVVWVRADGYDLVPFDVEPADFRQFLYCLATARWVAERDAKDAPRPIKGDALHAPAVVGG